MQVILICCVHFESSPYSHTYVPQILKFFKSYEHGNLNQALVFLHGKSFELSIDFMDLKYFSRQGKLPYKAFNSRDTIALTCWVYCDVEIALTAFKWKCLNQWQCYFRCLFFLYANIVCLMFDLRYGLRQHLGVLVNSTYGIDIVYIIALFTPVFLMHTKCQYTNLLQNVYYKRKTF